MNTVILCGRLTKDPDIRYTQGQNATCIARYTLAVDRRRGKDDKQEADFITCVAFGKLGEFTEKYCAKGTKLIISGRIQTGSYTNKDGQKVYTTDVVVESSEFAESKGNSKPAEQQKPSSVGDGFMEIPEGVDDYGLPFN